MYYYYLEWIDKKPNEIILTKTKPKTINFCDFFNIQKEKFCICGNINESFDNYKFPNNLLYNKKYYLSSHIQKSVRNMDKIKSIKSSKHLIDLDINCFLRRLPIIMLEDTTIHESFPIIIWIMIAHTKKLIIKDVMVKWLLGISYLLSELDEKINYKKISGDVQWENKNDKMNTLLYSLQFRKAYGGMKGDMEMIEYYKNAIINNKLNINCSKVHLIKTSIAPLNYSEWIISSNDFHCNKYMLDIINKKHPSFSKEELRDLIWIFSSSYNKRVSMDLTKHEGINNWNKIKSAVVYYQKTCKYY